MSAIDYDRTRAIHDRLAREFGDALDGDLASLDPTSDLRVPFSIVDESGQHSVPRGAQTHFRVLVVSSRFEGQTRVSRHRQIQGLLADEFDRGLHALAISAFTPEEWRTRQARMGEEARPQSPECLGSSKPGSDRD